MNPRLRGTTCALGLLLAVVVVGCGGGQEGPSTEGNEDLLTSDGFGKAVDAVKDEEGDDAAVIRVQVTRGGAQFQLKGTDGPTGLLYTGGELQELEVAATGTSLGQDFAASEIDAGAVDTILDGVKDATGDDEAELTALSLEKSSIDGDLRWTVEASGEGGRHQSFTADADGTLADAGTLANPGL